MIIVDTESTLTDCEVNVGRDVFWLWSRATYQTLPSSIGQCDIYTTSTHKCMNKVKNISIPVLSGLMSRSPQLLLMNTQYHL